MLLLWFHHTISTSHPRRSIAAARAYFCLITYNTTAQWWHIRVYIAIEYTERAIDVRVEIKTRAALNVLLMGWNYKNETGSYMRRAHNATYKNTFYGEAGECVLTHNSGQLLAVAAGCHVLCLVCVHHATYMCIVCHAAYLLVNRVHLYSYMCAVGPLTCAHTSWYIWCFKTPATQIYVHSPPRLIYQSTHPRAFMYKSHRLDDTY